MRQYPALEMWALKRWRGLSLSTSRASGRHSAAAGYWFDHPRLHSRGFLEDTLLLAEGANSISCGLQWLQPVMRHEAGLKRGIVEHVTLFLRPFLEKFDRVVDARDLPYQVLPVFQINRPVERLGVHISLLDSALTQRSDRLILAAIFNVFSSSGLFKGRAAS